MSGAAETRDDFHDKDGDNDIVSAWQDRLDMYTEDDWDMYAEDDSGMDIEELPATEHFEEGPSLTRAFGVHTFEHMVTLRGGRGRRRRRRRRRRTGEFIRLG